MAYYARSHGGGYAVQRSNLCVNRPELLRAAGARQGSAAKSQHVIHMIMAKPAWTCRIRQWDNRMGHYSNDLIINLAL